MSSDSEEENGVRQDAEESDGGRYSQHSRSQSRSRSCSRSRSRSSGRTPPREDDLDDNHQEQDRKENGMRGVGNDDYDSKNYDNRQRDRDRSRSKSPKNKDAMDWSAGGGGGSGGAAEDNKRTSRSRSKSKPRDVDVAKEQKSSSSSSSSKKKSRSRRSRSRSRSKRSRSRRRSRSRSRSYSSRSRRRSRSRSRRRSRSRSRRRTRSRSRSRSGTPVDGARLHVAELDVDTRKRDLERVFEKYGRLREIWMARNPPCFAFVVYAHQKDADRALKETDGIMIGHCRIKVTQARPRVRGGRMRGGYDPNLRCYQCGELGHFSRNCTDTKFGYKRPPTPPGVCYGLVMWSLVG